MVPEQLNKCELQLHEEDYCYYYLTHTFFLTELLTSFWTLLVLQSQLSFALVIYSS